MAVGFHGYNFSPKNRNTESINPSMMATQRAETGNLRKEQRVRDRFSRETRPLRDVMGYIEISGGGHAGFRRFSSSLGTKKNNFNTMFDASISTLLLTKAGPLTALGAGLRFTYSYRPIFENGDWKPGHTFAPKVVATAIPLFIGAEVETGPSFRFSENNDSPQIGIDMGAHAVFHFIPIIRLGLIGGIYNLNNTQDPGGWFGVSLKFAFGGVIHDGGIESSYRYYADY